MTEQFSGWAVTHLKRGINLFLRLMTEHFYGWVRKVAPDAIQRGCKYRRLRHAHASVGMVPEERVPRLNVGGYLKCGRRARRSCYMKLKRSWVPGGLVIL